MKQQEPFSLEEKIVMSLIPFSLSMAAFVLGGPIGLSLAILVIVLVKSRFNSFSPEVRNAITEWLLNVTGEAFKKNPHPAVSKTASLPTKEQPHLKNHLPKNPAPSKANQTEEIPKKTAFIILLAIIALALFKWIY